MSSHNEGSVNIVVIELEPGHLYVTLGNPRPEPGREEFFLRQMIAHWFGDRPWFMLDRTHFIDQHGALQGVHVWYRASAEGRQAVASASRSSASPPVFVPDDQIRQRESLEHIEALVFEAIEACHPHQDWPGTAVVVSPGRIAVVWDKVTNRGEIVPIDSVLPRLREATRAALRRWLEKPNSRRHVVLVDGSWFETPRKTTPGPIAEPAFVRANMTYDR